LSGSGSALLHIPLEEGFGGHARPATRGGSSSGKSFVVGSGCSGEGAGGGKMLVNFGMEDGRTGNVALPSILAAGAAISGEVDEDGVADKLHFADFVVSLLLTRCLLQLWVATALVLTGKEQTTYSLTSELCATNRGTACCNLHHMARSGSAWGEQRWEWFRLEGNCGLS
jgi:hypothetical protein